MSSHVPCNANKNVEPFNFRIFSTHHFFPKLLVKEERHKDEKLDFVMGSNSGRQVLKLRRKYNGYFFRVILNGFGIDIEFGVFISETM
jgi:hypothetical protein